MIKTKIEDLDITKAFKDFNAFKEHALVLISPSNNMNIYDKILYEYCYLKMFSQNTNVESKQENKQNSKVATELSNNVKEKEVKEKVEENSSQSNNLSTLQQQQKTQEQGKDQNQGQGQSQAQGQGQVITSLTEIKYKEIILNTNIDLTPQDFEYIRGAIKSGGVVIIKNAQLAGHLFSELIKEIQQSKPEEISPNFKFILI